MPVAQIDKDDATVVAAAIYPAAERDILCDMIELDMPVDVGIKLILSAGAVSPEGKPELPGD